MAQIDLHVQYADSKLTFAVVGVCNPEINWMASELW